MLIQKKFLGAFPQIGAFLPGAFLPGAFLLGAFMSGAFLLVSLFVVTPLRLGLVGDDVVYMFEACRSF